MKNERDVALHFYEMLTGVFDDEDSKRTRFVCFGTLIVGIMLAGFGYFQASIYSNTDKPLDEPYSSQPQMSNSAIQHMAEVARIIDRFRQVGTMRANAIEYAHNKPFNIENNDDLDPFSTTSTAVSVAPDTQVPVTEESKPVPVLNVKMIMTDEDGKRLAVVDTGSEKALVLRRGDKLGGGFVSSITPKGITVMVNKREAKYEVPEIPKYEKIK